MAFPTGWTRRAALTHVAVNEALSGFPVHLDKDCFPAEALDSGSANRALSTGADLRFTSDIAGTTELPFEVTRWVQDAVAGNRKASVHVKVPALAVGATTTIYVWYGNASASMPAVTDANGRNAVWDSSFVGVWHINNTSSIPNSAGNGAGPAATLEGAPATTVESPVGLAINLDSTNDAIHFGNRNDSDTLFEWVLKVETTSDHRISSTDLSGQACMSIFVSGTRPTAFMDTDGGGTYQYTFQDTASNPAQTSTFEYWAVRNRSTAGGQVVSRAQPATEQTHQASCNDGTSMYSIGGSVTAGGTVLAALQRYNPTANTWSVLTSMPVGAAGGCAVYYSGKIYHFGGVQTGPTASQRTDIYDVAGNSWSAGAAMPASLIASNNQGQRSALSDINTILVFQGTKLEEYDPVANTWTARADCPASTGSYASVFFHGGYLYALGGAGGTGEGVHRWNRSTNTWTIFYGNVPYVGWAHVCEPLGDGTWLVGFGRPGGGNEQVSALYRYDPAANTWTQLAPYEVPTNAAASAYLGGKLYVYGAWVFGRTETYSTGHHARYDYAGNAWDTKPALMEFMRAGAAVAGTIQTSPLWSNAARFYVGKFDGSATFTGPQIAEVRRSSSARSSEWMRRTNATLTNAAGQITVGTPAAVAATVTATASLSAAVQLAQSAAASMSAAVQASPSTSTALGLAVQGAASAQAQTDAAIQQARSAAASFDSAVLQARNATAGVSLQVQGGAAVGASIDVAVTQARSAATSLQAAIVQAGSATASIGAALAVQRMLQTAFDAVVWRNAQAQAGMSLYVQDGAPPAVGYASRVAKGHAHNRSARAAVDRTVKGS